MKSENFEILRERWQELAELGGFAEAYAHADPASALTPRRRGSSADRRTSADPLMMAPREDGAPSVAPGVRFSALANTVGRTDEVTGWCSLGRKETATGQRSDDPSWPDGPTH
jgi:hypothetical protein